MRIKAIADYSVQIDRVAREMRQGIVGPVLLIACATTLWFASLGGVDVRSMNGLGLVSILPASTYVAMLMLTASFLLTLYQRRSSVPLLLLHVLVLVFMLKSITTFVYDLPRLESTWKHTGITEYIMRNGRVDTTIDAYFNWPGFFILSAFMTNVMGLEHPISFAAWVPVFLNLLYLGPMLMIFSAATRVRWLR